MAGPQGHRVLEGRTPCPGVPGGPWPPVMGGGGLRGPLPRRGGPVAAAVAPAERSMGGGQGGGISHVPLRQWAEGGGGGGGDRPIGPGTCAAVWHMYVRGDVGPGSVAGLTCEGGGGGTGRHTWARVPSSWRGGGGGLASSGASRCGAACGSPLREGGQWTWAEGKGTPGPQGGARSLRGLGGGVCVCVCVCVLLPGHELAATGPGIGVAEGVGGWGGGGQGGCAWGRPGEGGGFPRAPPLYRWQREGGP